MNTSQLIPIAIIVLFWTTACAQRKLISAFWDIAIPLDGSRSVHNIDPNGWKKLLAVINYVPDLVNISEAASHVGVVVFGSSAEVALPLTSDAEEVRKFRYANPFGGGTSTNEALEKVKDEVFKNARPKARKIVLLLTDGIPESCGIGINDCMGETEKVGKELRDQLNAEIFVLYIGTMDATTLAHNTRLTGDKPNRIINAEDFDKLREALESILDQITCEWSQKCAFEDDHETCKPHAWLEEEGTCTNPQPAPISCDVAQCNGECDSWWPWELPKCGPNQGVVTIKREGPKPTIPPKMDDVYKNCPMTKEIDCATWTGPTAEPEESTPPADGGTSETTQSTGGEPSKSTTSTSGGESSESTTSTGGQASSETTQSTGERPSETTTTKAPRPTRPTPATPVPPRTTRKESTSVEEPESTDASSIKQEPTEGPVLSTWMIVLIVVISLLLLLLIIALIIWIVLKKRKQRKRSRHKHPDRPRHQPESRSSPSGSRPGHGKPSVGNHGRSTPPHYWDPNQRRSGSPSGTNRSHPQPRSAGGRVEFTPRPLHAKTGTGSTATSSNRGVVQHRRIPGTHRGVSANLPTLGTSPNIKGSKSRPRTASKPSSRPTSSKQGSSSKMTTQTPRTWTQSSSLPTTSRLTRR